MKRFLIFTITLFFTLSISGQSFISKVSAINGQPVKYESSIKITDSIITITSKDYNLSYIVENQIQHYYQVDQYGNKFNITIAPTSGKSFGFKYEYVITLLSTTHPNELPPVSYFAIKE